MKKSTPLTPGLPFTEGVTLSVFIKWGQWSGDKRTKDLGDRGKTRDSEPSEGGPSRESAKDGVHMLTLLNNIDPKTKFGNYTNRL